MFGKNSMKDIEKSKIIIKKQIAFKSHKIRLNFTLFKHLLNPLESPSLVVHNIMEDIWI